MLNSLFWIVGWRKEAVNNNSRSCCAILHEKNDDTPWIGGELSSGFHVWGGDGAVAEDAKKIQDGGRKP